jgi:hypothetical protein
MRGMHHMLNEMPYKFTSSIMEITKFEIAVHRIELQA